jgi:hypothetical protein
LTRSVVWRKRQYYDCELAGDEPSHPKKTCHWVNENRAFASNFMQVVTYVGEPEAQQSRFSYKIVSRPGSGNFCDLYKKTIGVLNIPIAFIPVVGGGIATTINAVANLACG